MKKNRFLVLSLFILCSCFVKAGYSDEYPSAYTRAFNNGITTQPTIDKANMNKSITRIELSKMISNYAINVLNKKPDTSKKCEFSDISDSLNTQYDNGVTNACQLGLMGQGITKFRPKDKVTRAEFGTILSRLLYGDKYNGGKPYYKKHLNQLNIRGIMTNINNPQGMELRGNVMVMLKRSETLGNIQIPSFDELDDVLNIKCEYENDISGDHYFKNLTKKDFILPYKDGYFGFSYGGQSWWGFTIEYRKLNNPCSVILSSDDIFSWNVYYTDGENKDYGDNYMFYSITEEKAKTLNCKAGDRNNCLKEAERYFYNLLVGTESNEHFSLWMNAIKKSVDNNTQIDTSRLKKYSECIDEYEDRYNVKPTNLVFIPISDEEKQTNEQYFCKLRKIKNYCAYKYTSACPDGYNCENLGSEINNCNNIIISTSQTTDERFPGYNVIYGGEGYHNIIGEKTVYYDDKIGISFKLGKEFDGGVIRDEYRKLDSFEWPRHLIFFYKKCPNCFVDEELGREGYDLVFVVQVFDNDNISGGDFPYDGEMTLIGNNNKYYFMGTEKTKNIDLNIFNVN